MCDKWKQFVQLADLTQLTPHTKIIYEKEVSQKAWTPEEDLRLEHEVSSCLRMEPHTMQYTVSKTDWKKIADRFGRSLDSVRGRYWRKQRARHKYADTSPRQLCRQCGEPRAGHVCKAINIAKNKAHRRFTTTQMHRGLAQNVDDGASAGSVGSGFDKDDMCSVTSYHTVQTFTFNTARQG